MSRCARHACPAVKEDGSTCGLIHMRSTPECANHATVTPKVSGAPRAPKVRSPRANESTGSDSRAKARSEADADFKGEMYDTSETRDKSFSAEYVGHLCDRIAKAEQKYNELRARCHCRITLPTNERTLLKIEDGTVTVRDGEPIPAEDTVVEDTSSHEEDSDPMATVLAMLKANETA